MATTAVACSTDDSTTLAEVIREIGYRYVPPARCQKYRLFIVIAMCSIGAFGLIGNSLSAVVFWLNKKKKTATMFLLQCLAVVDACVIVCLSLTTCLPLAAAYSENREYFLSANAYIVAYLRPVTLTVNTMTTWLTVMVAMQRYVAVCLPFHAGKYASLRVAWIQVVAVLVFSVSYNMVRFFERDISETSAGGLVATPTDLLRNPLYVKIYTVGLYYVFIYMIPLTILGKVGWSLTKSLRKRQGIRRPDKEDATMILLMIIIVFMICQLIDPIRRIWQELGHPEPVCGKPFAYYSSLAPVALTFNSSFNFVIYTLCSKRFRREFLHLFGYRATGTLGSRISPGNFQMRHGGPFEHGGNNTQLNLPNNDESKQSTH